VPETAQILRLASAPGASTLAEVFQAQGFATAGFVAQRVWMHPRYGHSRGFQRYEIGGSDARANAPAIVAWLGEQALALEHDPSHRFFLFAHFYDAHSDANTDIPYSVPPPLRDRYLPDAAPWGRRGGTSLLLRLYASGDTTRRDREFIRAYYDAGVRYVDEYGLGAIVAALREHELERDTLLVVTADHGEELFEHGHVLHGAPYDETTRVPFVLRGAGVPAGLRLPHLMGLVDLAPTILGLLELPPLPGAQGLDYSECLRGAGPPRDAIFTDGMIEAEEGWGSSVVADINGNRWSYIARVRAEGERGARRFSIAGAEELYHLGLDPEQRRDLHAAAPKVANRLRTQLLGWYRDNENRARGLALARQQSPLAPPETEHLEALGYLQ
jgi:arylsulfatase A-like enzyme